MYLVRIGIAAAQNRLAGRRSVGRIPTWHGRKDWSREAWASVRYDGRNSRLHKHTRGNSRSQSVNTAAKIGLTLVRWESPGHPRLGDHWE